MFILKEVGAFVWGKRYVQSGAVYYYYFLIYLCVRGISKGCLLSQTTQKRCKKKKCHYSYKTFAADYLENMENKNTLVLKENQVLKLVIKCFRLLFLRQD